MTEKKKSNNHPMINNKVNNCSAPSSVFNGLKECNIEDKEEKLLQIKREAKTNGYKVSRFRFTTRKIPGGKVMTIKYIKTFWTK